jgi:hypothetical protein
MFSARGRFRISERGGDVLGSRSWKFDFRDQPHVREAKDSFLKTVIIAGQSNELMPAVTTREKKVVLLVLALISID